MADDDVQYEFESVRTIRGREASTIAKWRDDGWELDAQNQGTLRTELTFRRVKPKTLGAYLTGGLPSPGAEDSPAPRGGVRRRRPARHRRHRRGDPGRQRQPRAVRGTDRDGGRAERSGLDGSPTTGSRQCCRRRRRRG